MLTLQQQLEKDGASNGLISIILDISASAIELSQAMHSLGKDLAGSENVHGEKQLKLDVVANDLFTQTLQKNPHVSLIASEEMEETQLGPNDDGFSVAFDPLDGSSLVDVNLSVGSIVGIYQGKGFLGKKGSEQVAAMMVVYGPRLSLLFSVGEGTHEAIFNTETKEFVVSKQNLELAEEYKMFAPGNLRACSSEKWYTELVNFWLKNGYTLRYSGGMVPDVNQILLKGGGIFTYPGYKEQPKGKLRLLYECAPLAFLVEQAKGKAIFAPGKNILDIEIQALHQKTPIFLGSSREVEKVKEFMNE